MKNSIKMILALALALTMICALGTAAFADTPITITKNPTNERHFAGESAMFIAGANNYDRIEWRFIAPNGSDFSLDAFIAQFPACSVKGQGTTTLVINNLQTGMDGWRAYCRFGLGNSYADTTAAVIGVSIPTAPVNNVPAYNTWDYVYYEPDYIIVDGARVYSEVPASTPTVRLSTTTTSPTTSSSTVHASTLTAQLFTTTTSPTTSTSTVHASTPTARLSTTTTSPTTSTSTVPASTPTVRLSTTTTSPTTSPSTAHVSTPTAASSSENRLQLIRSQIKRLQEIFPRRQFKTPPAGEYTSVLP